MIRKYFLPDIIFTSICLVLWVIYGSYLGWTQGVIATLFAIVVLAVLEISLSFDNVIVNVNILKTMKKKRQKRFITRGMFIAVFGMRVVFPVVLVAIFAHMTPRDALLLALSDHTQYAVILNDSHTVISGFGGAFLMMVGLDFFFNEKKTIHRFDRIERGFSRLGHMKAIWAGIVLLLTQIVALALPQELATQFVLASVRWLILYIIISGLEGLFGNPTKTTKKVAKIWLTGFLYLELLDASFSLDGVIGAFAISDDIIIIAMGLGIGAFFVRSLTIYMLEHWTLKLYRYLEHGAFYAILALSLMMFLWAIYDLPEIVTGWLGLMFIIASFNRSYMENKNKRTFFQRILRN